jgi:hypothetical protein
MLACMGCTNGRGRSEVLVLDRIESARYFGCVDRDRRTDRLFLLAVDDAPPRATGQPTDSVAQSTTANGVWLGTRQIELVGDRASTIGNHVGQRMWVTGVLEEQQGSTGHVDQIQHAEGVVCRRLNASSFEIVGDSCAIGSRPSEPSHSADRRP